MTVLLIIIHVIVCISLIMIVLLQTGKGADMGAAFGGGSSQTLFGSTGASTFLSKATTAAAIVFMVTSLILAYISSHPVGSSVMNRVEVEAPVEPASAEPTVQEEATPNQADQDQMDQGHATQEQATDEQAAPVTTDTTSQAPAASETETAQPAAQPESGAQAVDAVQETAPTGEKTE